MTLTDSERDEFVEILGRVFPKMDVTDQLLKQYGNVLQRAVTAKLAYEAIELYIEELDSPFPTPAGLKERVVRVNARYTTEHARDPLSIDAIVTAETRRKVHEAKLNRIQAKASPANDPAWDNDTPPQHEVVSFADWFEALPRDERRRVARVSPVLAQRYGLVLDDFEGPPADAADEADREKRVAVERARAMKRGGWR